MSTEKNVNKKEFLTTIMIFVLSAISAGVGALILFVPAISPKALCYIFCACLIILGIVLIAKFFAGKAFQKFHDYSFALGVLLVVMGCIGFVRVDHLTEDLDIWAGFIVLCIGIFLLQCSIQLKLLGSVVWIADIILTALIMISAIITLIYWDMVLEAIPTFPYWSVLIAGIINLINFPVVLVTIKTCKAKEGKEIPVSGNTGMNNEPVIPDVIENNTVVPTDAFEMNVSEGTEEMPAIQEPENISENIDNENPVNN